MNEFINGFIKGVPTSLEWILFMVAFFFVLCLAAMIGDPKLKSLLADVFRGVPIFLSWPLCALACRFGFTSRNRENGDSFSAAGRKRAPANRFRKISEAKDYLAGRIAAQAEREGVALTEIERKMLYFSSTRCISAELAAVSDVFDREYDQNEYEEKIATLVRQIESEDARQSSIEQDAWDQAVIKLNRGDHYLSVLVNSAFSSGGKSVRSCGGDRWRFFLAAFACIAGWMSIYALMNWLFGPDWKHPDR